MPDLLLEIGTEELPPGDIAPAMAQLAEGLRSALTDLRLAAGDIVSLGAPRRLAILATDIPSHQPPAERRVRGPAAAVGYDRHGKPTPAALGFARGQGVNVTDLEIAEEADGRRYLVAVLRDPGKPARSMLPAALSHLIRNLSFAKSMRWNGDARFARPVRWLVALLGGQVLPVEVFGVRAGRATQGHRTLHPGPRAVSHPGRYVEALRRGQVMVDPSERRQHIVSQVTHLAAQADGRPILDPRLLDETVMSVEHPTALRGTFEAEFLSLPREVLVTVMQHHQKYFAVEDAQGNLLPAFIAVRDGGSAYLTTVRQGHEWVLQARLADARFFFQEDRAQRLEEYRSALDGLVIGARLGTMGEKTQRLVRLGRELGRMLALDASTLEALIRAAELCKADLVTHLVGEFPELQGTIGQIYAAMDGEATEVSRAIGEHYRPAGAGDRTPQTLLGALLGLIDKTDTLTGAIAAGLTPSGSQDPYGLRRAGQGIVDIALMLRLRLPGRPLVDAALAGYGRTGGTVSDEVVEFLKGRLRTTLIDRGIRYDVVDAALAVSGDDLLAGASRAEAVADAAARPGFVALYVACDRASRILTAEAAADVDPGLFEAPIERTLLDVLERVRPSVAEAARNGDYRKALERLRPLVDPVNQIFDDVMIMASDPRIRANRLALLSAVVDVFRQVADFSKIVMSEDEKKAMMGVVFPSSDLEVSDG